jgi:hypothetical protein
VEKALSQVVQTERNLHLQQQSFTQQQRHSASSAAGRAAGRRRRLSIYSGMAGLVRGGAIELLALLGPAYLLYKCDPAALARRLQLRMPRARSRSRELWLGRGPELMAVVALGACSCG